MQLEIPTLTTLRANLELAILLFLKREQRLFLVQAGERTLTGNLAIYLRRTFKPWDVDCEYNRFGKQSKRTPIPSRKKSDNLLGHLVHPDIIVHKSNNPTGNLLALEAKSENDPRGNKGDREKLASYLGKPLLYPFVALLTFSATEHPWCEYELYKRGENPETPTTRSRRLTRSD